MRPLLFLLIIFVTLRPAFSQSAKKYPINFPQFFRAYPLVNPASIGSEGGFMDFRIGDLGNTGPFKEIRTVYGNGSLLVNKKNSRYKHAAGVSFYNDKEGDPIHRTRFYGNYALHIPLRYDTYLSSGFSFGMANYSFYGTTSYSRGSDINYDGSAGLWLYSDNYHIGISVNQIFNRKLMPIQETFFLAPYLSFTGSRKFFITETFVLHPHFIFNFYDRYNYEADLAILALIGKFLSVGGSYRSERGIVWIAGIPNIPVFQNKVEMFFSYSTPFSSQKRINLNSYQLTLSYTFYKKENAIIPSGDEDE